MPWHLLWLLFPLAAPRLQAAAIRAEVMDVREKDYLFRRPGDYLYDARELLRRCDELADAPPLSDCHRLPPRQALLAGMDFNRKYREYLEGMRAADPRHDYSEALAEVGRLYAAWDAMADAQCEYLYVQTRRAALKRLRDEILGTRLYFAGDWPPPVPVWRFRSY